MLIHPWDAVLGSAEWRQWLNFTDRFGMLVVNNLDLAQAPIVVPTHFTVSDDELLIHLARPNPIWPHLQAATEVRLAVIGDHAYIPGCLAGQPRRARRGGRADQLLRQRAVPVPANRRNEQVVMPDPCQIDVPSELARRLEGLVGTVRFALLPVSGG